MTDAVLGFALPGRDARGRIVRLEGVGSGVLARHAYPPNLARLLGEALALTAMLGDLLRPDEGTLTVQAQASGPVRLLVCDWRAGPDGAGVVRGYLQHDLEHGDDVSEGCDLPGCFGRGYLAITLDQTASAERYQGIVPLEGASLAAAAETYFTASEQVPTLMRLAAAPAGDGWVAAGLLAQHLPRGEEGGPRLGVSGDVELLQPQRIENWRHVEALAATVTAGELTDAALPLPDLLWRLFNQDEVRVFPETPVADRCRCSLAHFTDVLAGFPEAERAEMRGADGAIGVDCEFCATHYAVRV